MADAADVPRLGRRTSSRQWSECENTARAAKHDVLLEPVLTPQQMHLGDQGDGPLGVVRSIVVSDNPDHSSVRPVFSELMLLKDQGDVDEDPSYEWEEAARWIKYEETLEGSGMWSKPHVTLLSLQGLMQIRNCFARGPVFLDAEVTNLDALADLVVAAWQNRELLTNSEEAATAKQILSGSHFVHGSAGSRLASRLFKRHNADEPDSGKLESSLSDDKLSSDDLDRNRNLLRKLSGDTEACNILVGVADELERTMSAFVRLKTPLIFPRLPEVEIPSRFFYILLAGQHHSQTSIKHIGRTFGTLMTDEIFRTVAYRTQTPASMADAVDEFSAQIVAVPPGRVSLNHRWEPVDEPTEKRMVGKPQAPKMSVVYDHPIQMGHGSDLVRTGRCFGGFVADIRRKAPLFLSDFVDAFRPSAIPQVVAATIFLFFANVTTVITFGAVMEVTMEKKIASIENLVCGCICGVVFALFSGQPLNILSATGPTLVFEKILYKLSVAQEWDYLEARLWIGIWSAAIIFLVVATDASALVALITKFTEEAFAVLISLIYIIQAFEELIKIRKEVQVEAAPPELLCNNDAFPADYVNSSISDMANYCTSMNGTVSSTDCPQGDPFMWCIILFFTTFFVCYGLRMLRTSGYFTTRIRHLLGDFNVLIGIAIATGLNVAVGIHVPVLEVPERLEPTLERSWLIHPMKYNEWWVSLAAAIPAILYSILIIMDQQITAVIVNRKENKLKKGGGYHLDLAVLAVLIVICAFLGLPFYVAATVVSIMHVEALKMSSESVAPGEKPRFMGVREQRVTGVLAHILIGLSIFLAPVIRLVPLPVLLGVFLYMGLVSLQGQQLYHRFLLFFMPAKYMPDYRFLRMVPLKRVHMFTMVQLIALCLLCVVKYIKQTSMMFPLMLVAIMILRRVLNHFFSEIELLALDDHLPGFCDVWRPRQGQLTDGRTSRKKRRPACCRESKKVSLPEEEPLDVTEKTTILEQEKKVLVIQAEEIKSCEEYNMQ